MVFFNPTEEVGLAGAPFELFSTPDSSFPSFPSIQTVTATGNGTLVTVDTTFGLAVPVAGTTFYTNATSTFVTSASGIPFSSFFFQDPNRPNDFTLVYIGVNPLNIPGGTLVGASYDRTVSSVPEPSSFALLGLGGIGVAVGAYRRRRTEVHTATP